MKYVYKSSILNLKYSIVVFFKNKYNDKCYYISRIFFISPDSNNLYIFFQRI